MTEQEVLQKFYPEQSAVPPKEFSAPWRILFFGSCIFSRTVLDILGDVFPPIGIVSAPIRPKVGRREYLENPVSAYGEEKNIPVFRPISLRTSEALETIRAFCPDVLVVASYGLIIPQAILDCAPMGGVNVHPSLLPRWRGASPVQYTIWHNDLLTGVTLMRMNAKMDQGLVLWQHSFIRDVKKNAAQLALDLAEIGGRELVRILPEYMKKRISLATQGEEGVTIAHKLRKEDGVLNWDIHGADYCARTVLAMNPWPKTQCFFQGLAVTVWEGRCGASTFSAPYPPGTLLYDSTGNYFAVVCRDGGLFFPLRLQPAGKKVMDVCDFLRGYGSRFSWVLTSLENFF